MTRRRAAPSVVVLLVALMLAGAIASTAGAQQPTQQPPFSTYGSGLTPGDRVDVHAGGRWCGAATADTDGNWIFRIAPDSPCTPAAGDTVTFALNGAERSATETFKVGGVPRDVAHGVSLAAGASDSGPQTGLVIGAVATVLGLAGVGGFAAMRRRGE